MKQFYYTPDHRKVYIFNKTPINLSRGGMIPHHPDIRPQDYSDDTMYSLLEEGSLVIPRPVIQAGFMDDYDGPISQPLVSDKRRLVDTIVMPHEMVIPKKYASRVEKFLKKKGITLPLPVPKDEIELQ